MAPSRIHNTHVRAAVHLLLAVAAAAGGPAQSGDRPTASAIRALTREAQSEGKGDSSAIVLALDRRVRARWGDFESFPVSIVRRQEITISLATPYMSYRRALIEHLRMREPLTAIPWVETAVVSVNPERLEAPDITRVVVRRGGEEIAPAKNLLRPMSFTNGRGDTASLHAGEIHYPISAFAPGALVSISAIPASGDPLTLTLDDGQLRQLK
jgi:hypothetical protein